MKKSVLVYDAPHSLLPQATPVIPVAVVVVKPQAKPQAKPKPTLFARAIVTGYVGHDERCDGKWAKFNRTSTGRNATETRGVAVDPRAIPYGTRVRVPGVGTLLADDTGGRMREDWRKRGILHIDVRFPTFEQAKNWGVQNRPISLYR